MNSKRLGNGLKTQHENLIKATLSNYPRVSAVWLFGSRAIGTFKANSDIDLALEGDELNLSDMADILAELDQTSIPYKVDILIKHQVTNTKLLEHIEQYGVRWL